MRCFSEGRATYLIVTQCDSFAQRSPHILLCHIPKSVGYIACSQTGNSTHSHGVIGSGRFVSLDLPDACYSPLARLYIPSRIGLRLLRYKRDSVISSLKDEILPKILLGYTASLHLKGLHNLKDRQTTLVVFLVTHVIKVQKNVSL